MLKHIIFLLLIVKLSYNIKPFPLRRIGKINSKIEQSTNAADY